MANILNNNRSLSASRNSSFCARPTGNINPSAHARRIAQLLLSPSGQALPSSDCSNCPPRRESTISETVRLPASRKSAGVSDYAWTTLINIDVWKSWKLSENDFSDFFFLIHFLFDVVKCPFRVSVNIFLSYTLFEFNYTSCSSVKKKREIEKYFSLENQILLNVSLKFFQVRFFVHIFKNQ